MVATTVVHLLPVLGQKSSARRHVLVPLLGGAIPFFFRQGRHFQLAPGDPAQQSRPRLRRHVHPIEKHEVLPPTLSTRSWLKRDHYLSRALTDSEKHMVPKTPIPRAGILPPGA